MFMKKRIRIPKGIMNAKVTLTIDKELSKIDVKTVAPEKLAEANRRLERMKSLPK
jgi:hypothetical protein